MACPWEGWHTPYGKAIGRESARLADVLLDDRAGDSLVQTIRESTPFWYDQNGVNSVRVRAAIREVASRERLGNILVVEGAEQEGLGLDSEVVGA